MTEPDAIQRARKAVRGRYGADAIAVQAGLICELISLASLAKPQPVEPMADECAHTELGSRAYKAAFDAGRRDAIKEVREDGEPQPVGGALTADQIDDIATQHGDWLEYEEEWVFTNHELIQFARDIEAATLSAPVAQPGEAVSERPAYPDGDVVGPCVCGSWPGGKCLKCAWTPATPIAAQPATPIASAPLTDEAIIAIRNATWDGPVQPWGSALRFARGIEAALAAPAQAAAVPEAVERDAAGISPAPLAGTSDGWEVIGWEYRWLDTANKPNRWSAWERCRARNIHMNTDKDFADEIQAYIDMGNPYELRTLYTRAALSQGDVSGEGGSK